MTSHQDWESKLEETSTKMMSACDSYIHDIRFEKTVVSKHDAASTSSLCEEWTDSRTHRKAGYTWSSLRPNRKA